MGLRMKNFIIGFYRKIRILGGGEGFKKTIYRGNFLKGGLGQFSDLREED